MLRQAIEGELAQFRHKLVRLRDRLQRQVDNQDVTWMKFSVKIFNNDIILTLGILVNQFLMGKLWVSNHNSIKAYQSCAQCLLDVHIINTVNISIDLFHILCMCMAHHVYYGLMAKLI